MLVKCESCGKFFETPPYRVNRSKRHFCSHKCSGRGRSGRRKGRWGTFRCGECGKIHDKKISETKNSKHYFCSRDCFYKWNKGRRRTAVDIKCKNCGKSFEVPGSRESIARFCGVRCSEEWFKNNGYPLQKEKVQITCAECGRVFGVQPYRSDARFCSSKCCGRWLSKNNSGENNFRWKGGYEPYYGPNWNVQRRKARERDNYTCQVCGKKEDGQELDIHHIIPFREFKLERYREANQLLNLITLCRHCHISTERSLELVNLAP